MLQAKHSETPQCDTTGVVLVVDDDPFLLRLVCKQLQKLGRRSQGASSGTEALSLLSQTESPALIIVDFQLPDTNGAELAKQIRAIKLHRSTPIILMSATSSFTREVPEGSGINGLLAKPFTIKQLGRIIQQWSPSSNKPSNNQDLVDPANENERDTTAPVEDKQSVAKVLERNEVTVPVFDLQKLRSTFGEDDCLEVIRTFVSAHGSSPLRIQAAREAAALSDLRALAHKLKGAASMACLKELSQTSGMLEQASARSDWDEIDKLLAQLMRQFERADLALNSVLAGKA